MIIIIGASGFIGTYLTDRLFADGKSVLATGRSASAEKYYKSRNIPYVRLDISSKQDFEKLPAQGVEAVVLLAALLPANVSEENPYSYVDINITGTLNVLEYCKKIGVKKLLSTTSYADIQNLWQKDVPLASDSPRSYKLNGDHAVYVISKNAATDLILHYNEEYGMSGTIFRLPPVYGVGPHGELYVDGKWYKSGFQVFIEKAMSGEDIEIYGDKTISRDVVYVKDVVMAFIKAIESPRAKGVYNITSGMAHTLEEQVKDIIEVFSPEKKKSRIVHRPEIPNHSQSYLFDIKKAQKDFNYMPQYVPFRTLLLDYKEEMEKSRFEHLLNHQK